MEYLKFLTNFFNWKKGFLIDYFTSSLQYNEIEGDSTDYFKFLPEEIMLDILSRLPAESILHSKLVCTTWRNIVSSNPIFFKMYLHHLNHPSNVVQLGKFGFVVVAKHMKYHYLEYTYENHDELTNPIQRITRIRSAPPFWGSIVGSCNGLICLACELFVCMWNPFTREYVMLPPIIKRDEHDGVERYVSWRASFGYVSSTNEYKVVGMSGSNTEFLEVQVYTLGSGNGWRNLGKLNLHFNIGIWREHGIFANGFLYWMDYRSEMMLTFDVDEEKFCQNISPPPLPRYASGFFSYGIGVLDGSLFFAVHHGDVFSSIWLLKNRNRKEGEEHQSLGWTEEFRVDGSSLLTAAKIDGVLTCSYWCINIYNTKSSTSKSLVKFKNGIRGISPHKNTLISLKELGEKDAKVAESVKIQRKGFLDYLFKQSDEDAYIYL